MGQFLGGALLTGVVVGLIVAWPHLTPFWRGVVLGAPVWLFGGFVVGCLICAPKWRP